MREIYEGIIKSIELLLSLDGEIYRIILLSLYVSLTSTLISALIAIPVGIVMGIKKFPFKQGMIRVLYTFMGLPPVIVGLVVYLFIRRSGPLGNLELIFTSAAMIIAQTLLVTPIITGLVYNGTKEGGEKIKNLAKTLGANKTQTMILLIKELRISIFAAMVSGYGRAVSEVGAVMIVGGNIRHHTRVMTTTIAMNHSMGQTDMAIAIGIVLLILSFIVNSLLYRFQQGE
ncbi:ABC transporter permease [Alkaliphilus serpentinus]|uniref:ABC transporter permease subunit n=1 Tax=Alkaliphilus serpentinus TaxID=1482731 RepID=A0A833HLF8_9FIRM|nr:ABC transporter permease [Alkaliphilus serpentinus]KAB3525736.1 ABC transporter permease subunit [Alkaliphilus serpentinus]